MGTKGDVVRAAGEEGASAGPLVELALADLARSVGRGLGPSAWVVVGPDQVDAFLAACGRAVLEACGRAVLEACGRAVHQPAGAGEDPGPKDRPVPPLLLLALTNHLLPTLVRVPDAVAGVNYGTDKIRFPAPLALGEQVRLHGEIRRVDQVAGGFQVLLALTLEPAAGSLPVCTVEALSRFLGEGSGPSRPPADRRAGP